MSDYVFTLDRLEVYQIAVKIEVYMLIKLQISKINAYNNYLRNRHYKKTN